MKKLLRRVAVVSVLGFAAWSVPSANAAFCNTTGFPVCDNTNGKSCTTSGVSKRCIAPGICEWGICICQSGTWNCFY